MYAFSTSVGEIPIFIKWLIEQGCMEGADLIASKDGFYMVHKSISSMLQSAGVDTFPDRDGKILKCENFFDDWFLFSVSFGDECIYGLLKMREQERDRQSGVPADGDTPGVTVSFISFDHGILRNCLEAPTLENRKKLGMEINRVVAYPKQKHHAAMKQYFIRPQAEAPYLIAEIFTQQIASFHKNGVLHVPDCYLEIYKNRNGSTRHARIPDFLEQNNRKANSLVCDHRKIYLRDAEQLTDYEKLAILATHTGNVSFHSFAAEIRFHAMFLAGFANVRLPVVGSPYGSAIRADMSIGDAEFQGPAPYYRLSGKLVRTQMKYHMTI